MTIYTIYKAINRTNQKIYVGFDSNWPNRQKEHIRDAYRTKAGDYNTYFHRSIRKYSPEGFDWEIVYQGQGDEELGEWILNKIEPYFIQEFKTHMFTEGHHGYNMTLGGDGSLGRKHSVESRIKMCAAKSGNNNPMFNRVKSQESKIKTSNSMAKSWIVSFPNGEKREVNNLFKFAKEHNLNPGSLSSVAKGKAKNHKGFIVQGPLP